MPQVDSKIKSERSARLIKLSEVLENEFINGFVGQKLEVLFEKRENGFFEGHTSNYIHTLVETDKDIKNKIIPVVINKAYNGKAVGTLCDILD